MDKNIVLGENLARTFRELADILDELVGYDKDRLNGLDVDTKAEEDAMGLFIGKIFIMNKYLDGYGG